MKLVCLKSDLLNAVNIVLKAVPSKTTMSLLQCILIDASSDIIKFTANDTELGIETIVKGEILEKGIIAIDAKIFSDIIRKLPDNKVSIDINDKLEATIKCEKSKFNLLCKDGSEFSYLPILEKTDYIYLSQFSLKEIIRQTLFCVADNDTNKIMTGELLDINGNMLKMVALDGHRIAIRNIELKESFDRISVIIPGKTLNEVSKILPGGVNDDVKLFFSKNHITFEFDNTVVVSRLIDGEYFRIEQMLSSDYSTKAEINRQELINCIDRATLLVKESDGTPIIFDINDNNTKVKLISNIGTLDEEIDVNKEGKDIMIGFNPRFFMDSLKVIDDENVKIYLVNPKAPCFIKDDEGKYIYLVLPVSFNLV